jgi:hypothetical protein
MKTNSSSGFCFPVNSNDNSCTCGLDRRAFLQRCLAFAGGCACCLPAGSLLAREPVTPITTLVSPGCRRSKVKVAKLYLGVPNAHWPTPKMDLEGEHKRYETWFGQRQKEFADVDFFVDQLVTKKEEFSPLKDRLQDADGILLIHLSMGMGGVIREVLTVKRPTVLFAAPYSGRVR